MTFQTEHILDNLKNPRSSSLPVHDVIVERRVHQGDKLLDDIKFLAGRVKVIELVLDQIVSLVNTPLDYYVMARKR